MKNNAPNQVIYKIDEKKLQNENKKKSNNEEKITLKLGENSKKISRKKNKKKGNKLERIYDLQTQGYIEEIRKINSTCKELINWKIQKEISKSYLKK